MNIMRAYKFSIYPDAKRQKEIDGRLLLAKEYYNLLLEKTIGSYKEEKAGTAMAALNRFAKEIEKDRRYLLLYSQTRCEIKFRVLKAYQNFFRRIREKKAGKRVKAGFPRFKSIDKYRSITYPQDNGAFSIEKAGRKNMLRISRIGRVQIEPHRAIEGKIKTMTIKRESNRYYAIFAVMKEMEVPEIVDTNPVGIDMGLNSFIATSDGIKVEKPKFVKRSAKHIARWQRTIARRIKGSKRREKAKARLQKKWKCATNQSNDFMHKLSNELVNSSYTSFAVERLSIQNMVRNHSLAQSIYNASWNRFMQFLSYKAESAGMRVIEVDARNTSRTCSNCGNMQDMPLSERTYACARCGMRMDRDINASINILNRAREGHSRSNAQGDNVRPQHGAVVAELRTYPGTNAGGSLGL
jgi:putative transposase